MTVTVTVTVEVAVAVTTYDGGQWWRRLAVAVGYGVWRWQLAEYWVPECSGVRHRWMTHRVLVYRATGALISDPSVTDPAQRPSHGVGAALTSILATVGRPSRSTRLYDTN